MPNDRDANVNNLRLGESPWDTKRKTNDNDADIVT